MANKQMARAEVSKQVSEFA